MKILSRQLPSFHSFVYTFYYTHALSEPWYLWFTTLNHGNTASVLEHS